MISTVWARLPVLAGTGALALTACGLLPHAARPSPSASGPPPAWSVSLSSDLSTIAQVDGTLVVDDGDTLSGLGMRTGKRLWTTSVDDAPIIVAGNVIVVESTHLTMIDAASGKKLWTYRMQGGATPRVTQDAVFTDDCPGHGRRCTLTRRDVRTGHVRWRIHGDAIRISDEIDNTGAVGYPGVRDPAAPPTERYIASDYDSRSGRWGARDTATGRKTAGRVPYNGWLVSVAGRNLINIDEAPPGGYRHCTVRLVANDVVSGKHRWTREISAGRIGDGDCEGKLAISSDDQSLIGAGTRVAAATADGRPQLFDMATGRTVWRGTVPGVPIDGNSRGILVRAKADTGKLSMLDFATGRVRWTAPDPGINGLSSGWNSAVTDHLVAVGGAIATGDDSYVQVYDAATGRRLGRYPGLLETLGDGWVVVRDISDDAHPKDEFIRL